VPPGRHASSIIAVHKLLAIWDIRSIAAKSHRKLLPFLVAALLAGTSLYGSGAALAGPAPTVALRVVVRSPGPVAGNAVRVTNLSNALLGTCQEAANHPARTTSCVIQVPANVSILVTAQPAAGQAWQSFFGSRCQSAPGPVCHIAITLASRSVFVNFGPARPGPSVTAELPLTYGHSPTMSLGDNTVTVNGTGFPPDQAATLTDDGAVVASGMTGTNGAVTLSYNSSSEPGVYRELAVQAGHQNAQTDIYNTLVWTWGEGNQGTGAIFFVINETDMDANLIENYVQFDSHAPRPISFGTGSAAQGYAQIQTPAYSCAPGAPGTLRIYGTRGAGQQRYAYNFSIPITC
jgi:hypothetical protein